MSTEGSFRRPYRRLTSGRDVVLPQDGDPTGTHGGKAAAANIVYALLGRP